MDELTTTNQSGSQAPQTGQPNQTQDVSQPQGDKHSAVNLHDLPEFRNVQSSYERQMANLRQVVAAQQQQLNAQKLEGMDDFEKEQFKNQQLQQQLDFLQRQQDIAALSAQYGVPPQQLEAARTYAEAERIAMTHKMQEMEKRLQGLTPNESQKGYIPTGQASATSFDRDLEKAKASGDPARVFSLYRKRRQGG
jgi:hypothetical protein